MATAEELLVNTVDASDTIVVDLNSRELGIPDTMTNLGVMSDDDVKRLYFVVPRHYRDIDLSEFDIRINFQNAAGNGDQYPVPPSDIEVDDSSEEIRFSWLVDRTAFESAGKVTFSVCMVKYDNNGVIVRELNTTIASLEVLKGLETSEAVVENNPSAFDNVLFRLKAVENAMGLGVTGYFNIIDVKVEGDNRALTIASNDGTVVYTIADGKTPVKGVDYFTEDDKTELETDVVDEVTAYVDAWAPIAVTAILLASKWVDNKQTVYIEGVAANNLVFAGPKLSDVSYNAYIEAGIQCIAQSEAHLIFSCAKAPEIDVVASVCVYHNESAPGGSDIQSDSAFYKVVGSAVDKYLEENPVTTPDTQTQAQVVSGHTSVNGNTYTMTLTMEDGSTSVNLIETENGVPTKITVDGVEIPLTWEGLE